jgi:hypothetical protein
MTARILLVWVLLGLWATPTSAFAGSFGAARTRIVVEQFRGPGSSGLRSTVMKTLKKKGTYEIVSDKQLSAAIARSVGAVETTADYLVVARELKVTAVLAGTVTRGKHFALTLKLHDGTDGTELGTATYRALHLRSLASPKIMTRLLKRALASLTRTGASPALAQSSAFTESDARRAEAEVPTVPTMDLPPIVFDPPPDLEGTSSPASMARVEKTRARGPHPFEASLGLGFVSRDLDYVDDFSGNLEPYNLGGTPAVEAALDWFPWAHSRLLSYLGVCGALEYTFDPISTDAAGKAFASRGYDLRGGIRARKSFARGSVSLTASYGRHAFLLFATGDDTGEPPVPDVTYDYARAGAHGRLQVSRKLALELGGAYRHILSTGEIGSQDFFSRATAGGVDMEAAVTVAGPFGLELRAGVDLRRYFFSMNPEPGDTFIAGGAVDQYLTGSLAVRALL